MRGPRIKYEDDPRSNDSCLDGRVKPGQDAGESLAINPAQIVMRVRLGMM
jgi:hypothetical protein